MRILCVSDIHYHLRQLDWILDHAGDYDVVVLPGDHLDSESPTPLTRQTATISEYFIALSRVVVVLVASGNHDLDGPGRDGEQRASWLSALEAPSLYIDGQSVDLDGIRFTVCPWWDGPLTKELVVRQLKEAASERPEHWIWVYHSPPTGTRVAKAGHTEYGDTDLAEWIHQWRPDIVLCGHIHQSPWATGGSWVDRLEQTWVFNAGHETGPEPSHIVIDLSTHRAEWIAIPDKEQIDLTRNVVAVTRTS